MNAHSFRIGAAVALLAALSGCSAPKVETGIDGARAAVGDRVQATLSVPDSPEARREIDRRLTDLLSSPLDAEAAVAIALLNNRHLRAAYARLGMSRADLIEASQLENPILSAAAGFPDRPPSGTALDLGLTLNIVRLLTLPARQDIARSQLDAATLSVADEVVRTAGQTHLLFLDLQASANLSAVLRQIAVAAEASLDFAQRLHTAGNISDLGLANYESMYEQARLEYVRSVADVADVREQLNAQLGLWGEQTTWSFVDRLPELPVGEPDLSDLEALAIRQRLDLAAAAKEVELLAQAEGLQRDWRSILTTEVGFQSSRDTEGQWVLGPDVSIELPIFNQRQPEMARLESVRRQAEANLEALAIEIRSEVRRLRNRLFALRYEAEHYRDSVLPLRERITELTQREYNFMLVDTFGLLAAKREEIATYRSYLSTIHDYWAARIELERAVGGRLPIAVAPQSSPDADADEPDPGQPVMHHHGDH